jgi:hypothetical protein
MSTPASNPLTPAPHIPASLGPLANSYTNNELEEAAQAIFMQVFEALLRPRITAIETQAVAHRASLAVVRQAVTADGLAMERPDAEEAHIRQLYRAWKARNPRRGLHFLVQYLQLLWPGKWEAHQLWCAPDQPYPEAVSRMQRDGYFLTSRVMVAVEVDDPTGAELLKLRGSFRTVLAARLVILMALLRRFENKKSSGHPLRVCAGFHPLQTLGVKGVYLAMKRKAVPAVSDTEADALHTLIHETYPNNFGVN